MSARISFRLLGAFLLASLAGSAHAQDAARPLVNLRAPGALPLRVYEPGSYPGESDNWAALTDDAGRLYVGNGQGVFVVSGPHVSSLLTLPNKSVVRSLARGADERIFVGGAGEIGYLEAGAAGQLQYRSLLEHLPAASRDFGDVWQTEAYGDDVFFYTYRQLMRWSPGSRTMQTWQFVSTVVLVKGLGQPLLQNLETGALLRLVDGHWVEMLHAPILNKEPLRLLVRQAGGDTLAVTGRGLYRLAGGRMVALPAVLESPNGNPWIYDAETLPGGDLALATLYSGVVIVDAQGRPIRRLSRAEGLPDDVALALAFDGNGLWICLERGLVRADLSSGVTLYGEREGLHAYASDVEAYRGEVYLAGLQRFARLPQRAGAGLDVLDAPTDEVLALEPTPQGLFVASRNGLRVYQNGRFQAVPRFEISGDYPVALLRSRVDTTRFYVGHRNGLALLRLEANRWVMRETFPQVDVLVASIAEGTDGSLWLGTNHEDLLHVAFRGDGTPEVSRYGPNEGLPRLVVTPFRLQDELLIHTVDGFFRPSGGRIVRDSSALSALFHYRPHDIKSLNVDAEGSVWMVVGETAGVARRTADGYRWEPIRDRLDAIETRFLRIRQCLLQIAGHLAADAIQLKPDFFLAHDCSHFSEDLTISVLDGSMRQQPTHCGFLMPSVSPVQA